MGLVIKEQHGPVLKTASVPSTDMLLLSKTYHSKSYWITGIYDAAPWSKLNSKGHSRVHSVIQIDSDDHEIF